MNNRNSNPLFVLVSVIIILFSVSAAAQTANHLVISQAFGGGGINVSYPTNDFVELYNPTSGAVSVAGWSLQYALGTSSTWIVTNLSGSVPAHGYYLIILGSNNALIGTSLPTADVAGIVNMSSVNAKLGLVNNTTALTGVNPSASCVDFLGTGTANGFEGAVAAAGSNTLSWQRKANNAATAVSMTAPGGADAYLGNGWDGDNNSTDFVTQSTVVAHNSSNIVLLPLVFKNVSTSCNNMQVSLQWLVGGETGVNSYVIERALAGSAFKEVGVVHSAGATPGTGSYSWTDPHPETVNAFYRIRARYDNGHELFSTVMEVQRTTTALGMQVYPNPVTGQAFSLHFLNQPAGVYTVTMYSLSGCLLYKSSIQNPGGIFNCLLNMRIFLGKGNYLVQVCNDNKNVYSQRLFFR